MPRSKKTPNTSPALSPEKPARSPSSFIPSQPAGKLVLPDYWPGRPEAWFIHLERCFRSRGVTSEEMQYQHTVPLLPPKLIDELAESLIIAPQDNPFTYLKDLVLTAFREGKRSRLYELLDTEKFATMKPSDRLRWMQSVVGDKDTCSPVVREHWFTTLPDYIRFQLATSWQDGDMVTLSKWADSIFSARAPTSPHVVNHIKSFNTTPRPSTSYNPITSPSPSDSLSPKESYDSLLKQVEQLRLENERLRSSQLPLCWFHCRYGDKANQCLPPCRMQGHIPAPMRPPKAKKAKPTQGKRDKKKKPGQED